MSHVMLRLDQRLQPAVRLWPSLTKGYDTGTTHSLYVCREHCGHFFFCFVFAFFSPFFFVLVSHLVAVTARASCVEACVPGAVRTESESRHFPAQNRKNWQMQHLQSGGVWAGWFFPPVVSSLDIGTTHFCKPGTTRKLHTSKLFPIRLLGLQRFLLRVQAQNACKEQPPVC